MHPNFVRYNKGGELLEYQQQKWHYNQTLHPRKTMRISEGGYRKNYISLHHHNKLEHEVNRQINHDNRRLFNNIKSIQSEKGILGSMEQRAQEIEKSNKKCTLVNKYKQKEKVNELRKRNRELMKKVFHIQPTIGNVSAWDSDYENFKKQEKKISRATLNVFRVPRQLEISERQLHSSGKTKNNSLSRKSEKQENNKTIEQNQEKESKKTKKMRNKKKIKQKQQQTQEKVLEIQQNQAEEIKENKLQTAKQETADQCLEEQKCLLQENDPLTGI